MSYFGGQLTRLFAVVSFSLVRLHSEFPRGWGCSSVVQDVLWVLPATTENGGRPEGEGDGRDRQGERNGCVDFTFLKTFSVFIWEFEFLLLCLNPVFMSQVWWDSWNPAWA